MSSAADMLEERIRERAYYIWEASGRPPGRDEEFWRQACEVIANGGEPMTSVPRRRKPKQSEVSPPRRGRQASRSGPVAASASADPF